MHNSKGADPLEPMTKEQKKISAKRKKTDADYEQLAKYEFMLALYQVNNKAIIPSEIIEGNLVATAKSQRKGKLVLGSVLAAKEYFLLEHDGEQDVVKRFDNTDCRNVSSVVVQRARIMRTRPIFNKWSANIEIKYDESSIAEDELKDIISQSGDVGIMDWRPKFGRFEVEFLN